MPLLIPTTDDVQELHAFILERAEEEHAAIMAAIEDETIDPGIAPHFFRISNSHKLTVPGLTAYILDLLKRGDDPEQTRLTWDHLTAAGEEWRDHPDYLTHWENPQRARVRQMIAGG